MIKSAKARGHIGNSDMRERAHQKGEGYLKNVEAWITDCFLLGFETELFGDAYDPTSVATQIGGTCS